jgi:hypothetical protein
MSEVAAVAAITGGSSVLTSAITALVTWRVSKNSSSVELATVGAENDRLQQSNREEERRNRQSTYHEFLDVLTQLFQSLGVETEYAAVGGVCDNYTHLLAGVLLFGPPSVRDGAHAVNEVYAKIWPALSVVEERDPEKPYPERWRDATAALEDEFNNAVSELISLMHADVTRGIADEQET